MNYNIYTDGATTGNGQEGAQGGSAFIIIKEGPIVQMSGWPVKNATNNICELDAIIQGCRVANIRAVLEWEDINPQFTIYSDSAYIINCYKDKWYKKWQTNGWLNSKKQPVANRELWEQLIPYFEDSRYSFVKVMGHSGNKYNEIVDRMAVAAKHGKSIEEFTRQWLGYEEEGELNG